MTSIDPSEFRPSGRLPGGPNNPGRTQAPVFFDRRELREILDVYGRMVANGEWRDYAIDGLRDAAIFSVFRRSSEVPLYRIEKHPRLRQRQGAYAVVSASGHILKRGHELAHVLKVFERKRLHIVGA